MERHLLNFLKEDIGSGDITSSLLPKVNITADIVAKEQFMLAGLAEAKAIFKKVGCSTKTLFKDGDSLEKGDIILEIKGLAYSVLSAERTALNIISRMSGIATLTNKFVQSAGSKIKITATRKTTPGFRYFEKKAVKIGCGDTHRYSLYDMILLKNNHIKVFGGVENAILAAKNAKKKRFNLHKEVSSSTYKSPFVEIEISNKEDALIAAKNGADIIMLDNMKPEEVEETIRFLEEEGVRKKVIIECSGGINLDNIRGYSRLNIDFISVGAITHSVKGVDISLRVV